MIRVMVVDDSPLVRKVAGDMLETAPDIEVVATASCAELALARLERDDLDVITLVLEMPGMGGLEAIRQIMARRPTPIIVLSPHARRGAELTLYALECGAVDFMLKPIASLSGGLDPVATELVEKVRGACGIRLMEQQDPGARSGPRKRPDDLPGGSARRSTLVAIGASTGGPVALRVVLSGLPANFPAPIVVVQHMPPVFTRALADRLDSFTAIRVKEAEDGDPLLPGQALIAPGDFHLTVSRRGAQGCVLLSRREPVNGRRPAVDVLMQSVAREYGADALGVIMTGMGKDGAAGARQMRIAGGQVLAQDQQSSAVFGMNREVIDNGDADLVDQVDRLAEAILERAG